MTPHQAKAVLRRLSIPTLLLAACAPVLSGEPPVRALLSQVASKSGNTQTAVSAPPGTPFSAEKLESLLPATVYFQGRSAPLQLRNAAGTTFGDQRILWAALVDTSGYSTGVQEKYQFYLVTEAGLRFGEVHLPAGAYGGGYIGDHFLLMDLGGHTVGEGKVETDTAFRRPRPLQLIPDRPDSVKLYLGRRWVVLQADPSSAPAK